MSDEKIPTWRCRPTIMSGLVVTYATHFEIEDGVFGPNFVAKGCFEVSASRDAVMVPTIGCPTT